MDFYNQLLAQKLSGGGGGDINAAFKALVDGSITEVTADMLESATSIKNFLFSETALTNITIPNNITTIGISAFNGCRNLTSIKIPNSITSISSNTFSECTSLTSIEIPNSVTSINSQAFFKCSSLTSITIPNGVTQFGYYALSYCSSLTSATIEAISPPAAYNDLFRDSNRVVIYVPAESVDAYKAASGWSTYADKIQAIPSE